MCDHCSIRLRHHDAASDADLWIAYALACDHPEAVRTLAVTEAVIPGLAEAPPIFVAPEENIFLWHFLFNQVRDLPELLMKQTVHFFEHYKDLEPGKWVKILGWGTVEDAKQEIVNGLAAAKK